MNENWMFKNLDRSGNSDQQLTIVRGWEASTNQTQNHDDHLQRIQSLEATDQEKIFYLYLI